MAERIKLTMSQALVKFLIAQRTIIDNKEQPLFPAIWAIFGHGNVAGLGEALYQYKNQFPTYRGHNEQSMAHIAIAYAKAKFRKQIMATTTSIGPGATNLVTAAAVAYVNRLPVLLLPGDVFANRSPDPVLQQAENFADGTISANDCFKPVSRYFDRITRPEQIISALYRAVEVLTSPDICGPVTLSLCQDVQAEAYDYPVSFFEKRIINVRRINPDRSELQKAAALIGSAKKPFIIAGGGVIYSEASKELKKFCDKHNLHISETQAGKSSLPYDDLKNLGPVGVTGGSGANYAIENADLIIAIGTRLQDFTTASGAIFKNKDLKIISINVQSYDAIKYNSQSLVGDALVTLKELSKNLKNYNAPNSWSKQLSMQRSKWHNAIRAALANRNKLPLSDREIIGIVQSKAGNNSIIVGAAGSLPGELHKLWQATFPGSYHLEYGYSCMGYEIAGGIGVKLAQPKRDVFVLLGDGSYLMLNSEISAAVMLNLKLTIIVTNNEGFACINRLQQASGGASYNNMWDKSTKKSKLKIDFRAHGASLGAFAQDANNMSELEQAMERAKAHNGVSIIVVKSDPDITTEAGGYWWDVAIPEVSKRKEVTLARKKYLAALKKRNELKYS